MTSTARATSAQAEVAESALQEFDRRGTATVAGAHFSHDLYSSFLGPLIPAVQEKLGISLFLASLMVPAQQMPSIVQPFVGAWADRTSKRWFVVLAPAVAAVSVSLVGLAPHVGLIILLLLASGLASAAFHAPAIALVGEYGGAKMGRAMSIFMAGGEASRSLGPLVITAAISWFTLEGSFVVMVFGVAASVILYFTVDTTESDRAAAELRKGGGVAVRPLLWARRRWLAGLFGFTFMVTLYNAPFSFFLVKYLDDQGRSDWYSGFSLSIFFAAGAIGGIIGGSLSDRFGRRIVLITTMLVSPPLFYLYLWIEDGQLFSIAVLVLVGMISMANRPIQLALAQDILPEARGQMSGLMLAFGFVTMSMVTLAFGAIADRVGTDTTMWWVPFFAFLAVPFIQLLPRRGESPPMPA